MDQIGPKINSFKKKQQKKKKLWRSRWRPAAFREYVSFKIDQFFDPTDPIWSIRYIKQELIFVK